jgi:hypothetical protein
VVAHQARLLVRQSNDSLRVRLEVAGCGVTQSGYQQPITTNGRVLYRRLDGARDPSGNRGHVGSDSARWLAEWPAKSSGKTRG